MESIQVAILARRSLDKENFENQLHELKKWISKNGYVHYGTFFEDEHGNTPQQFRDVLLDMFKRAENGEFRILAVWNTDRLTREGGYSLIDILKKLIALGIKVYSHTQGWIKNENAEDEVLLFVHGYKDRKEREDTVRRTKNALDMIKEEISEKGYHVSRRSGRRITFLGAPKLFSDKQIRDIIRLHESGWSLRAIAEEYMCSTHPISKIVNGEY